MEPNIENIHKWIAALRSGEYPQGTGRMRLGVTGDYRYCPLGVAAQIADPTYLDAVYGFGGSSREQRHTINEFYGIVIDEITLPHEGGERSVIILSDNVKLSFAEIADLLEAEFPKPVPVGGIVLDIPRAEDLPVTTKVMEMVIKCDDQEVLVTTSNPTAPEPFIVRRHGVWTGDPYPTWAEAEAAATLLVQQAHRKALAIKLLEEKLG